MSGWLQMFLSLSANVYCLVMGEFSTNDKGPLLTSNGAPDKAGTRRSVPGGGFSVLGMAGYKQAFMIATTLMCILVPTI